MIPKAQELAMFAQQLRENAETYARYRTSAGRAKAELDILLAAKLATYRSVKKNLGYEMSLLMLAEDSTVARELLQTVTINTAKYKGLEKVIDSLQSTISLEQSIMKYEKENS